MKMELLSEQAMRLELQKKLTEQEEKQKVEV